MGLFREGCQLCRWLFLGPNVLFPVLGKARVEANRRAITPHQIPRARFLLTMDNNFTSWLSQSSWERRQAWAKPSGTWHSMTVEEEVSQAKEEVSYAPQEVLASSFLEDGFLQGSSSNKIETWLEECSISGEPFSESISIPAASGSCSNTTSFEDDLSLGAEAMMLLGKDRAEPRSQKRTCWPSQHLNLDHSMTSSAISVSTNKTSSSISEVLDLCEVDAETILSNLGFIQEETRAASWIPPRFFSVPSQAEGIDFQLFLRAQVQRLEMEDPCVMLASRFKQVKTLAVTADAFFCLYSYVSKTPIQKISPAHLFWDFSEISDSCNVPSKQETLSPLKRLQRAISMMCLYTSPQEGGPPGPSSMQSPLSRLEQIVWEVMEKTRKDRFHFDVEGMKDEAHMVLSEASLCHSGMGSDSSESTVVEGTPVISSCFCPEDSSHSGEKTGLTLLGLRPWFSHCTGGASLEGPDHLGHRELYNYRLHSPEVVSSAEEGSEESSGEWSIEKDSTPRQEDCMGSSTEVA
ncbi:protein TESPA1 [Rhineura floridana]|uniref:protein TESPA1 n=1 Tax=Rhineura floridana TaxID=261503 RepID=UPI002AC83EBC|nr:protein TESPA1 [Rhineura floridana]